MTDSGLGESGAPFRLHRVAGEDAPGWLSVAFSATGLFMAMAASYLAAGSQPAEPMTAPQPPPIEEQPAIPEAPQSPAPPVIEPSENAPGANRVEEETKPETAAVCLPIVSIGFAFKSSRPMTEGAQERVAPLVDWLRNHSDARLLVEGHTDSKGAESYNVMLSYSRAQAIIAWLTKSGVQKSQLTALAAGPAQPEDPSLIVAENRMALLKAQGVAPCHGRDVQGK